MKKDYNNTDERILAGFRRFSKILRQEAFGHHGKARILNTLCAEGPISQKQLQDEVEISSGSASELLKKMEEHGLIVRKADPNDNRGLIVEVTDAGREMNDTLNAEKSEKAKGGEGAVCRYAGQDPRFLVRAEQVLRRPQAPQKRPPLLILFLERKRTKKNFIALRTTYRFRDSRSVTK